MTALARVCCWKRLARAAGLSANKLITKFNKLCQNIAAYNISAPCKIKMAEKLVVPAATYALPLGILDTACLETLDTMVRGLVKRVLKLPMPLAKAAIHNPAYLGGVGIASLHTVSKTRQCGHALETLNDKGRIGMVARALMDWDFTHFPYLPHAPNHIPTISRQVALVQQEGMHIYKQGEARWARPPPAVTTEVARCKIPNVDGYLKSWPPKYHALLISLRVTTLAELLHPGNTFKYKGDLEAEGHMLTPAEKRTYRTMIYHLSYETAGPPTHAKLPVGYTCKLHPSYGIGPKPKKNWVVATHTSAKDPMHLEVLTALSSSSSSSSSS